MDFDEIFEQYFDKIYYKVLGVVKNQEDAEDISQEVFMSVFKNLGKFREESNIYTWIYKIAINKINDFFRKRKEYLELNEEIVMPDEGFSADVSLILQERLKELSSLERQIVTLKDFYGYKLKEIADLKNMNISTVKSIYYKAIKDMGGN